VVDKLIRLDLQKSVCVHGRGSGVTPR
jgi:hypothetical protein